MDVSRTTSIYKIMMKPHDITMKDISNIFFDTFTGVSNMRYIDAQQFMLDHHVEEREINRTL
jgi:hypothetical protein